VAVVTLGARRLLALVEPMNLLRIWLWGTGSIIALLFVYAYVPILIPVGVMVAFLAVLTTAIVLAARRFERWWLARRR
jgi:hypothetical protein